jgi:predicted Zn-dependent peptidase
VKANAFWVMGLRESYFLGEDPAGILRNPVIVESMSPQRIQEAARKCFDTDNYLQFVLMPEKESGK